jgi:ribosomal protein S18 acetylase RimI-like enzyme
VTFPLTEELVNQIIFAMEDQRHRFVVDRETGAMFREDELPPGQRPLSKGEEEGPEPEPEPEPAALDGVRRARYLPIPTWGPAEGFHLMERFVLKLRNPIFAEMLREALSSGQGVFRRFKDILRKNREIERLWFAFKDKEMKQVVQLWYEAERELAGLERLAAGEEPAVELVASDFSILRGEARHVEAALKLDRKVHGELDPEPGAEVEPGLPPGPYDRSELPPLLDARSLFLAAELAGGEFAGFVWAVEDSPSTLRLTQLAVRKHFRGIGLGTQLLRRLLELARERGYARVLAPLQGDGLALSRLFEGLGFSAVAVELAYDLVSPE